MSATRWHATLKEFAYLASTMQAAMALSKSLFSLQLQFFLFSPQLQGAFLSFKIISPEKKPTPTSSLLGRDWLLQDK